MVRIVNEILFPTTEGATSIKVFSHDSDLIVSTLRLKERLFPSKDSQSKILN